MPFFLSRISLVATDNEAAAARDAPPEDTTTDVASSVVRVGGYTLVPLLSFSTVPVALTLLQAALLAQALTETRQSDLLADAYQEAWARGEAWQEAIVTGLMLMPDNGKKALADALGVKVDSLGKD